MERNYSLNLERIACAYKAYRDFHNAPSGNDSNELDVLSHLTHCLNIDESAVYYELVRTAYLQGREDGWKSAFEDWEDENV